MSKENKKIVKSDVFCLDMIDASAVSAGNFQGIRTILLDVSNLIFRQAPDVIEEKLLVAGTVIAYRTLERYGRFEFPEETVDKVLEITLLCKPLSQ